MTHLEIRRLTAEDADKKVVAQVALLIAEAFIPLEVAEWLVPDPTDRVGALLGQFAMFVEGALKHGRVHVGSCGSAESAEIHAAAVWYSELDGPHSLPDDYDARLARICGKYLDRFQILDDAFAAHHQASYPHHCLTHLATLPEYQNHGLGRALLRYAHRQLDIAKVPAYLVASNIRTRDWYASHGYQRLHGGPLQLPDGLQMWPMWREPQPSTEDAALKQQMAPAEDESR